MSNAEAIEKEIPSVIKSSRIFEQIADLRKVEGVKNDIVGLLCCEVSFDLSQRYEQQHDSWEHIPKYFKIAETLGSQTGKE